MPITLLPVIVHLHQRQGVTTLWKGIGSVLLVRGMTLAVEDVISKFTPWPKEINAKTTVKQFGQHLLLKCISIAAVVPFYSASLVETVQSDIASEAGHIRCVPRGSEPPAVLERPAEGPNVAGVGVGRAEHIARSVEIRLPAVCARHLDQDHVQTGNVLRGAARRSDARFRRPEPGDRGVLDHDFADGDGDDFLPVRDDPAPDPAAGHAHNHRQSGLGLLGRADSDQLRGVVDCYRQTLASEGVSGLYKGFGAMVLQFAAHVAVIKLGKWFITQISELMSSKPPAKVVEFTSWRARRPSGRPRCPGALAALVHLAKKYRRVCVFYSLRVARKKIQKNMFV